MPWTPSSLPWPECFTPANGSRGSEDTIFVDEDHARFKFIDELLGFSGIMGHALAP
jgi:hypothetical protein